MLPRDLGCPDLVAGCAGLPVIFLQGSSGGLTAVKSVDCSRFNIRDVVACFVLHMQPYSVIDAFS